MIKKWELNKKSKYSRIDKLDDKFDSLIIVEMNTCSCHVLQCLEGWVKVALTKDYP